MAETPQNVDAPPPAEHRHFIQKIIDEHVAAGRWGAPGDRSVVRTRFPPEPNGYLHIGHAKSIHLNHGLAQEFGGAFVLRFDDTNPVKEEQEYVDSIIADARWLGVRWEGMVENAEPGTPDFYAGVRFASDYFPAMYAFAIELVGKGLAYVDEQDADAIRTQRGTLTEPGTPSPFRDRPAEESLDLLERMKNGEIADGAMVLRAKIDMASPNLNLRDPVMYRVVNKPHHRTGDDWHIYPMYDWAHGLEDSIEGITNSICTLEFEAHRPLYDWFIDAINRGRGETNARGSGGGSSHGPPIHHPQQTEFARLSVDYTITSKRKLLQLVEERRVRGWDDPRLPTVSGLRRGGYTPESIRAFVMEGGATKFNAAVDVGKLENAVRSHLNQAAPRCMCVLDPVRLVIENWNETADRPGDGTGNSTDDPDRVEWMDAVNNPEDASAGTRRVPFSRELYVERVDFMEDPPKKFFRLGPGREVRLRYGFWVTCTGYEKDPETGEVTLIRATYDPETRGGDNPPPDADGKVRKVKGTIHWVSAEHAVPCEVRLFDRLFRVPKPEKPPKDAEAQADADGEWSFLDNLNPDSLTIREGALLEPEWHGGRQVLPSAHWPDGIERVQFERHGYFCLDADSTPEKLVWNRTVGLRDSWK
ncbi:MAG: glutamine--tRNA ligase/YqeY domain fusion protein [Planctomycetota bacterium]